MAQVNGLLVDAAFVAVTAEQDWTRNRDRELEAQTGGDAVSRANR